MTVESTEVRACIHACQNGCGRPYDSIIVQAIDGATLFYCQVCMLQFAYAMVKAMTEPDDPQVMEVMANASYEGTQFVTADAVAAIVRNYSDPTPEDEFDFDGVEE